MSKHTPGPWETGSLMTRVEIMPEGWNAPMCIADCHAKNAPQSECERVANAHLIAAAPELLECLTDLVSELEKTGLFGWAGDTLTDLQHRVSEAQSAIAKAEGNCS